MIAYEKGNAADGGHAHRSVMSGLFLRWDGSATVVNDSVMLFVQHGLIGERKCVRGWGAERE